MNHKNKKTNPLKSLVTLISVIMFGYWLYKKIARLKKAWDSIESDLEYEDQVDLYDDGAEVESVLSAGSKPQNKHLPAEGTRVDAFTLLPRQEQVYQLIKRQGEATMKDIMELAPDVSTRTLRRDMTKLEKLGLISQAGKTRDSLYKLKK